MDTLLDNEIVKNNRDVQAILKPEESATPTFPNIDDNNNFIPELAEFLSNPGNMIPENKFEAVVLAVRNELEKRKVPPVLGGGRSNGKAGKKK